MKAYGFKLVVLLILCSPPFSHGVMFGQLVNFHFSKIDARLCIDLHPSIRNQEAEAERKAEADRKRKEKERLAELAIKIARRWAPADFGQGTEGGKLPTKAIANIREALIRMLGKAPELPEATAAQWPLLLELAP